MFVLRRYQVAVANMLDAVDDSRMSWREKLDGFIDLLIDRCSASERSDYLEAAARIQTGEIRVSAEDLSADDDGRELLMTLANAQEAGSIGSAARPN